MSTHQHNAAGGGSLPAPPLIGTYVPPDVREGDRVYCRFRKGWCRVTGWSPGPIRWPRVQQIGVRGRPGLLVDVTLERAIRTESALALAHWLGLSPKPVTWWRRAFGVAGHVGTPGTRELQCQKRGARSTVIRPRPEGARVGAGGARVASTESPRPEPHSTRPGPIGHFGKRAWSAAEIDRLGTDMDEVVAAALGRTAAAVRRQRCARGIPPFLRAAVRPRPWAANEVARLGTDVDEAVATALGRTVVAVISKRIAMRIPPAREPATRGRSRPSARSTGALA
ncbi:hypothetical protein J8F10_03835 [Gemmata sp. G18]|uniref:Helix-turn-helix domain-containing protein n=1 Tax=Gemmata palustris TaxID=2822762 RepID=A0ABS5BL80_9BACT|nr:hypothetical protein [Gemmata palustris]MBP3954420.1 hypothetical protein [Gemmata palustris]